MLFRRHDRSANAARWLSCAEIFFLLLTIAPRVALAAEEATNVPTEAAPGPDAEEVLLLDVRVNGHSIGKIGEFRLRAGKLMAQPNELRDLGFKVPASLVPGPAGLIALADVPGLIWSLDQKSLELNITVNDNGLLPTLVRPGGINEVSGRRVIESGTGLTLNYDTVGTFAGGQNGGSGSMDLRAFSPWGIVSSDWLGYTGATSGGSGATKAVRLDSAFTFADVNSLRRYSLGDFITGGLAWTRPVHLEGAQIRSDFSMRPDLITFPLPTLTGSAAVPSTIDILADGNLTVSSQVAAGPFEVPQLPVVSGAGTISMTVTNALGQQVTMTEPFYASSSLLAPGLQTFAIQSGLVRRNWGSASNDYGKIAGTAIFRCGLTSHLTLEVGAEGTPGTVMLGGGGVAQIGHLGELNFAAATSSDSTNTGAQFSVGAQRIGRVFSLGGAAIMGTSHYRDVASMNGDGVLRKQLSGFTSLYLRRFGSIGAAYAEIDQDAPPTPIQTLFGSPQHSQVVSANYSLQIRHVTIYASEFKNIAGTSTGNGLTGGSSGFQFGLTIPFGKRGSVSAGATSDGNGQLQVQKSAALVGDWGYDAYVSAGNSNHEFGEVHYKSPTGLFTAGVDQSSGLTTVRTESQGAFSWVDGGLFPSNTIYDSFAIVDTNPIQHVQVLQENRNVGSTGSSGRLLVPDMRSFDLNHIAIAPTDIPPDVTIDVATREMRPQDRSGVVVKFPIKVSHGALLKLVDEAGVPMPIGSTATLKANSVTVPVGYDGDAYVEDLGSHNELTIERPDGRRCTVAFEYRPLPGDVPTIGPLRCKEQRP